MAQRSTAPQRRTAARRAAYRARVRAAADSRRRPPQPPRPAAGKPAARKPASPQEKRRTVQLLVSGVLLVVAIAVKLLMPDVLDRYRARVLDLLGADTDFVEVFSAAGRAFSEEGAIGGALNALIHLPALANELGLECTWTQVAETTSHTPVVCNVVPNGDISCVNLYKAGGIPAVLKTIEGDLDTSVMTVTGKTLEENLAGDIHVDRDVIRTQDDPASVANGIQVLYGNLAPEGALVKTSAVPADQHVWSGPAMVFNSEEEAFAAYNEKRIVAGTGVVVRYEGPKGGPGMKELHRVTEIMKGIPNSAVITDGRFSGASGGLSVGYLCPEALDGAPIALIQDGDVINIDLTKNLIEVEVSDEELARRKQDWKPVIHENGGRLLARYAQQVGSAKTGAVIG